MQAGHGAYVSSVERSLLDGAARMDFIGGANVLAEALNAAQPTPAVLQHLAREIGAAPALRQIGSLVNQLLIPELVNRLEPLAIDAVADPIPAHPGWVAELWVNPTAEQPTLLGVYPVLAWEPEPQTSIDDYPQGHAMLLVPDRDDDLGSHSGPISTRDLPGQALYRREDAPPFQPPSAR